MHELTEVDRHQFLAAAKVVELVSQSVLFGYRDRSSIRIAMDERTSEWSSRGT
jgi:hypothetical protein